MKYMSTTWLLAAIAHLSNVLPYTSGEEAYRTTVLLGQLKDELWSRLDVSITEAWLNAVADASEEDTVVYISEDVLDHDVEFESLDI